MEWLYYAGIGIGATVLSVALWFGSPLEIGGALAMHIDHDTNLRKYWMSFIIRSTPTTLVASKCGTNNVFAAASNTQLDDIRICLYSGS